MVSEHDLGLTSERELQAFLATGLRDAGWTVTREHRVDASDRRVDIVAQNPELGVAGIEAKYVTNSGPKEAGAAVDQILTRYAGETYDGSEIDMWGVALYGDGFLTSDTTDHEPHTDAYQFACRRLVNQLGIGYVILHRDLVMLDFGVSVPALRVPLFNVSGAPRELCDGYADPDVDRLEAVIQARFPE